MVIACGSKSDDQSGAGTKEKRGGILIYWYNSKFELVWFSVVSVLVLARIIFIQVKRERNKIKKSKCFLFFIFFFVSVRVIKMGEY